MRLTQNLAYLSHLLLYMISVAKKVDMLSKEDMCKWHVLHFKSWLNLKGLFSFSSPLIVGRDEHI